MIGGPNDTLDMSDCPPATREELELSAEKYAERAYKLGEENKRLREALHPFAIRGAGLYYDTRLDGTEVVTCRQCNGETINWAGPDVGNFEHEFVCIFKKARAALMAGDA